MKNPHLFFLPALGWLIISTVLFTLPGSAFPKETWYTKIPLFDKWVHIAIFIILSFLLCRAFYKVQKSYRNLKGYFIWIGVLCLLYGITIEYIQLYWVANRSFDFGDILADAAGAISGVFFSIKRYKKNRPL